MSKAGVTVADGVGSTIPLLFWGKHTVGPATFLLQFRPLQRFRRLKPSISHMP